MADDITAAHHSHPGAPPSSFFAVMDPTPCSCTVQQAVKQGGSSSGTGSGGACDGSSSNTGKNDDGGSDVGGDAKNELRISLGEGHETHNPPLLWPGDGNKLAHRREQGPVVHGLRLKSAYAQQADAWGTGEPAFTSYHHMFKVTLSLAFVVCLRYWYASFVFWLCLYESTFLLFVSSSVFCQCSSKIKRWYVNRRPLDPPLAGEEALSQERGQLCRTPPLTAAAVFSTY